MIPGSDRDRGLKSILICLLCSALTLTVRDNLSGEFMIRHTKAKRVWAECTGEHIMGDEQELC